jgi:hypothetical protein
MPLNLDEPKLFGKPFRDFWWPVVIRVIQESSNPAFNQLSGADDEE